MTEFTDASSAPRLEKAKRVLRHLANGNDMTYFFHDGYPREKILRNDARAALEVLEELEQKPPTPQQVSDYLQMVENLKSAVGHNVKVTRPAEGGSGAAQRSESSPEG